MNLNNQSTIQRSKDNKFLRSIEQFYDLCCQILQIDQFVLRFLPTSIQPYRETFERFIDINVMERAKKLQLSLHLTSAYFSNYLSQAYFKYLSKLREVPTKVKLLLPLDSLRNQILKSLNIIQKSSCTTLDKHMQIQISNAIISPNNVIKQCQINIQLLRKTQDKINPHEKLVDSKNMDKRANKIRKVDSAKMMDKQEIVQFYKKKQFDIEEEFVQLILWKYQACMLLVTLVLEKESKKIGLSFIKFNKKIGKSDIIPLQIVPKIYAFCLQNIIKKQTWIHNDEEHIYFQLQLKKILRESKIQLSQETLQQIDSVLNKIKQKSQLQVLRCYKPDKLTTKPKNLRNKTNSILENSLTQDNHNVLSFTNINNTDQTSQRQIITQSFRSAHLGSNHFVSNASAGKYCVGQRRRFQCRNSKSQSLNKIKQYQLDLRKQRQKRQQQQTKLKASTTRRCVEKEKQQQTQEHHHSHKHKTEVIKVKSRHSQNFTQRNPAHKISLFIESGRPYVYQAQGTDRFLTRTPSKIYLTIKDKVSKQLAITSLCLQNEIFMLPQFKYQKPKITFQQILNDAKTMQQRENQSQTNFVSQNFSEVYIQKIQVDLEYFILMNYEPHSFRVIKLAEYSEQFACTIRNLETGLQNKLQFQDCQFFTFKTIKSIIQSTDLFFQLMQIGIKTFKIQPVLALSSKIKNLTQLQKTDNPAYYSQANCLNLIVQIGNYIQPYICWYFTKKNKINGAVLQKRKHLQMTDPLKFSINYQYLKKNDYAGCVQLFQAVRNKKGLNQCLKYLSQGRQMLCKQLAKVNNKYIIQTMQFHPKYLRQFQINRQNQLIFPLLKLYLKSYQLFDQIKHSNALIIQRAFAAITRPTLKREPARRLNQVNQAPFEKVNMRQMFTNEQCNKIIINNLNKNFIERRFIVRMLSFLELKLSQGKTDQNHEVTAQLNEQSYRVSVQRRTTHTQHPIIRGDKTINADQDNLHNDIRLVLQSCIFKLLASQIDKNSQIFRKNRDEDVNELFKEDILQKNKDLCLIINRKLKNFQNFLINITQNYQHPLMFCILNQSLKKLKIHNKFYQLHVYRFASNSYLLVLNRDLSQKQWVMYVSQSILMNFDYLTFKIKQAQKRKQIDEYKLMIQNQILSSKVKRIKINIFGKSIRENSKMHSQNDLQISLASQYNQHQNVYTFLLPSIINSQSGRFQLDIMQTPYYNKLSIHRFNSSFYFVNSNNRNNNFSVQYNHLKVILKKVINVKNSSVLQVKQKYIYMAVSWDSSFSIWRLDFYSPKSQRKFVVFLDSTAFSDLCTHQMPLLPKHSLSLMRQNHHSQLNQKSINGYIQLWRLLIAGGDVCFDFDQHLLLICSEKFRLFQTFGSSTLTPLEYIQQDYFERLQVKSKVHPDKKLQLKSRNAILLGPLIKNSGKAELLKYKQQVVLLLLNYQGNKVLTSHIDQNPIHIFANIFSEHSFKQSEKSMYQNLFRRLLQKLQRNRVVLDQIQIGKICEFQEPDKINSS